MVATDLSDCQWELSKADDEISRLREREAVLVEALKDAEVAVELLNNLVNDDDFDCDGPNSENFKSCGHRICERTGCIKWKIGTIEEALATVSAPVEEK